MDELLHHCLRELSFDGDLGSNVSRLRDFIVEFYSHTGTPQNPDDAFCAFVWSLVVQQPTVRVGVVPPGITFEVWVAPQTSAKRKAKAKGEEHIQTKPTELQLVFDAKNRALVDLKQQYGNNLRIAVDPDAIYAAITGTHIRFPKLSPMVYSALQIITRGRENGVTVVQLGQQSKYDQKTCFYLVRQLTELDLVVKVRRGGVGTHFCIHKYFFDRSPSWKAIRDEETRAEGSDEQTRVQFEDNIPEEESSTDVQSLDFTPIDSRHLSSLPLIRARVVRLLKASRNQMHASNNMLITLGFVNPTKTDRRFFQSRIREMIQQGVIEKVVVPSNRKKSVNASVKCFRLVTKDQNQDMDDGIVVQSQDADEDEKDIGEQCGVKMNITIHKQIIDLLEDADTVGMTLNELSTALCHFDKRTIELLLTRAEKFPPPRHLSDLGISGLMETSGRERRHRYYTTAGYRKLVAQENLDNSSAGCVEVDLASVGGFAPADPSLFYDDETRLSKFQDSFKEKSNAKPNKAKKIPKNPVLPNGSVKQGRPRKYPPGEDPKSLRKRKREEVKNIDDIIATSAQEGGDSRPKKKAKRTKKPEATAQVGKALVRDEGTPDTYLYLGPISNSGKTDATPKKGGRPTKPKPPLLDPAGDSQPVNTVEGNPNTGNSTDDLPSAGRKRSGPSTTGEELGSDLSPRKKSQKRRKILKTTETDVTAISQESHVDRPLESVQKCSDIQLRTTPNGSALRQPQSDIMDAQPSTGLSIEPTVRKDQGAVQIDPILLTDVLERTKHILHGSANPPIGSAATELIPMAVAGLSPIPISQATSELTSLTLTPNEAPETDIGLGNRPRNTRVNVSHLRRENELYRVIENMGGIVNIQTKEFFQAHTALLDSMAQAGEPSSAPAGTKTDKRTAAATINNMEQRGRIKQLKTAVMTHTGVHRPACIVYLPTIDKEKLDAFLADLARGAHAVPQQAHVVKIDEHVEYGADSTSVARGVLPLQLLQMEQPGTDQKERWSKNVARAEQLFSYEDAVIREVLLTERTTLGQIYGFIVGKMIRTRELHLFTLGALERGGTSSNVVSLEKRIVDLSYFCHDIPLGPYCALISSLSYDEELTHFLTTEEGRQTLVKDVPQNIHAILQIGRSRARSRFLDILETLRALQLVTPLRASASDTPWISCAPVDNRPHSFDVAPLDGWSTNTPMAAPVYWHFNEVAPIHIWAASESSPPFWKDVPVASSADASIYWRLLQEACSDVEITPSDTVSSRGSLVTSISVARSLRRGVSWNPDYILTWHQMQYLRRFTDVATAKTPLENEDGGRAQIETIAWVVGAPLKAIVAYYQTLREKLLRELEKARKRLENRSSDKRAKRTAAAKASLAKKAADARIQREQDWEVMISRIHPDPLDGSAIVRLRRIRSRFLQAGLARDSAKWESEITEALHEADIAAKKVLKVKRTFARSAPVPYDGPLPNASNPPEKSIETLIAQQGPPLPQRKEKAKRKRRGAAEVTDSPEIKLKVLRRHRFRWNRDYEELARDASAIIKARCRNLPRLDWAAFEQVFPAVPRNTVRQRLAHIKENPGNEAYLNRLEDRWHELWMQHRGTPLLPDDDPQSTSNFSLIKHIEFLRQHIDKNALRVGFAQPKEAAGDIIPGSVDQLFEEFQVIESSPSAPPWDFMWNAVVEEGREKRMMRQPFTRELLDMPHIGDYTPEEISLAESAVKMTLGTPNERYDAQSASDLLHGLGEQVVSSATKALLNRGVLSKLVRDPQKQKPGRQLKISETNQNAIGGSIPRDIFQDATGLEDISSQDGTWREWPLLSTDGDCAALIQIVSDNKAEFRIDTSNAQAARPILDWNSKKADDDQIEISIHVQIKAASMTPPQRPSPESSPVIHSEELGTEVYPEHGKSKDDGIASCRLLSGSRLADCAACLESEWVAFNDSLEEQDRAAASQIVTIVREAGQQGVKKRDLLTKIVSTSGQTFSVIRKMTDSTVPLLFWAGYTNLVLVSSAYVKHWSVSVSENPITRIFPRRWYDISGVKVLDFWEAALRAVMGVVLFRPGISQAELRWRLRSVYDRQEVTDLLRSLQEDGYVKARFEAWVKENEGGLVGPYDESEEKGIFWFIGERHWYQEPVAYERV